MMKKRKENTYKHIIDDNSDMYANIDNYSYDEWEDFCHFTNNSLLMLCIKKNGINFV